MRCQKRNRGYFRASWIKARLRRANKRWRAYYLYYRTKLLAR
jgi:hypothetical protein